MHDFQHHSAGLCAQSAALLGVCTWASCEWMAPASRLASAAPSAAGGTVTGARRSRNRSRRIVRVRSGCGS